MDHIGGIRTMCLFIDLVDEYKISMLSEIFFDLDQFMQLTHSYFKSIILKEVIYRHAYEIQLIIL